MSKELVRYHNDLNSLSMRQWTAEEMDLFFSIVNRIQDKGTRLLELDTNDLRILANSEQRTYRWVDTIERFTNKAMNLVYREDTPDVLYVSRLFARFKYDKNTDNLEVKVNDDFEYIVNKLTANFTVYELAEFTSLKSTYSKTMYRILKQWKSLGEKEFNIDQFRELLDIPKSYTSNNIKQRVIKPIEKELPQYFTGLKIKPIKKNTQGTPVIAYKFTWQAQKSSNQKWIADKYKKNAKHKSLAEEDNRMTKAEREAFVEEKLKMKIPIDTKRDRFPAADENFEGQISADDF